MTRAFRLRFEIEVEGDESLTVQQAMTGAGLAIAADPDRFLLKLEPAFVEIAPRVQRPVEEELR